MWMRSCEVGVNSVSLRRIVAPPSMNTTCSTTRSPSIATAWPSSAWCDSSKNEVVVGTTGSCGDVGTQDNNNAAKQARIMAGSGVAMAGSLRARGAMVGEQGV